jgi:hypothetical protein
MIDKKKIVQFAKDIYTEDIESWVYADEFAWYLQKIADKFPELNRDIFNNVENNDCWEVFYQIFISKGLKIDDKNFCTIAIEVFYSDRVSYETYLELIEYYVDKTIAVLDKFFK